MNSVVDTRDGRLACLAEGKFICRRRREDFCACVLSLRALARRPQVALPVARGVVVALVLVRGELGGWERVIRAEEEEVPGHAGQSHRPRADLGDDIGGEHDVVLENEYRGRASTTRLGDHLSESRVASRAEKWAAREF